MKNKNCHVPSFILNLLILFILVQISHAYTPPIGIKNPDWGSIHPIDTQSPAWPSGWPSQEVPGYYYYDNRDPNCSDNNSYGYPAHPRCSIPRTISYPAGSYVEIHGGPYIQDRTQVFVFNGTENNPVWFRGGSGEQRPILGGSTVFNGTYAFIENLYLTHRDDRYIHTRVGADTGPGPYYADHLSFRHIEVEGDSQEVSTGYSAFGISGNSPSELTGNIVFYDMHIHDVGSSIQGDVDYHGFKIDEYAYNIWILDSNIHHLQGDSVQVGSYYHEEENKPHHVWVGGNTLHENAENALDVKNARDLIFASNDMYGFYANSSSAGNAVGIRSYDSRARNVWIINNKIHQANIGIKNQNVDNVYVLSNLIFEINTGDGSEYMEGVYLFDQNNNDVLVGNVMTSDEYGLAMKSGGNHSWDIEYNYFLRSRIHDIIYEDSEVMEFDHNKFSDFSVLWGDHRYSSLTTFQSTKGLCLHCVNDFSITINPEVSPRNNVVSSVAKESLVHPAYTVFENLYSVDIKNPLRGQSHTPPTPQPSHPPLPIRPGAIMLLLK